MAGDQKPDASEGSKRLRRFALLVGGLAVLAGIWFLTPDSAATPTPGESQPGSPLPAVSAAAPPAVPAAPAAPPGGTPPPDDPIAAYKERTRYAPTSGALGAEALDLLEPNRRYERPLPIRETVGRPEDEVVSVHFEADHYFYSSDETVTATLHVVRGGEPIPVDITKASVVAEDASGEVGDAQRLVFRLFEGEPETELRLDDHFADHHGTLTMSVEFEYEPGKFSDAHLRIFSTPVSRIPAHFSGRNADALVNGSLVFDAGVVVDTPGFYRIDANLFGASGEPIAFASFKGNLDSGSQQVPLQFFGLLLRDQGVAGPYEVRNLRGYLFRDGLYPDRLRMRDAERSHWTREYELAGFSDDEYTSPHKANMIQLLEADQQAGLIVELPVEAGL